MKTYCKRGHKLSGENVRICCGRRVCRACRKSRERGASPAYMDRRRIRTAWTGKYNEEILIQNP